MVRQPFQALCLVPVAKSFFQVVCTANQFAIFQKILYTLDMILNQ